MEINIKGDPGTGNNFTHISIGKVENVNPNVKEVRNTFIVENFKRRRITHQIAADKIGTPKHTVTNQLSRKKRFGERLAKKLSDAFGYSITWLLYGEGEMFSDGNDAI